MFSCTASLSGDVNNYFSGSSLKTILGNVWFNSLQSVFLSHASQNAQIVFSPLRSPYGGWGEGMYFSTKNFPYLSYGSWQYDSQIYLLDGERTY